MTAWLVQRLLSPNLKKTDNTETKKNTKEDVQISADTVRVQFGTCTTSLSSPLAMINKLNRKVPHTHAHRQRGTRLSGHQTIALL